MTKTDKTVEIHNVRLEILDSANHHFLRDAEQRLGAALEAVCVWIENNILGGAGK